MCPIRYRGGDTSISNVVPSIGTNSLGMNANKRDPLVSKFNFVPTFSVIFWKKKKDIYIIVWSTQSNVH